MGAAGLKEVKERLVFGSPEANAILQRDRQLFGSPEMVLSERSKLERELEELEADIEELESELFDLKEQADEVRWKLEKMPSVGVIE